MHNPLLPLVYDRVVAASEEAGLAACRASLLAGASGAVLEIGAGTGLNLGHYPAALDRLVLTDPDPGMLRRLRRRVRGAGRDDVEVLAGAAEALPFPPASFDEVVSTLVLCSVEDALRAAAELRRVVRPGGRLRFVEHVAATPDGPSRLQRALQPLQRALAGGCRLDHSMAATLRATGWRVAEMRDWELPRAVPWVRPAVVGVAIA